MKNTKLPPVLDVCCGGKMFYFNKNDERVLFMDKRCLETKLSDGRDFKVTPDIVGDFTALPFDDNTFYHVVFDPPHLVYSKGNNSKMEQMYGTLKRTWASEPVNSEMAIKYGYTTPAWKTELSKGFEECFRVLRPQGVLNFKWAEIDIKVSEIIKLSPIAPLYGIRSGKTGRTHWMTFIKPEEKK